MRHEKMPRRLVATLLAAALAACAAPAWGQAHSVKKGWAGGGNISGEVNPSNADWYYSWWHTRPAGDSAANADWIPLIKFYNGNFQSNLNTIAGYNDVDTLLVFNEPERADQSDITVEEALEAWPLVQQTLPNHKLVLAGVSNNQAGRDWMASFMAEVSLRNNNTNPSDDLRVDAVAFHWYGAQDAGNPAGAANNFLSSVDYYYNQYGLPVWITEFAIHDWDNDETEAQILQANADFLEIVIPALESLSYVEKYAFYTQFKRQPEQLPDQFGEYNEDARFFEGVPPTPTVPGDVYVGTLQPGDAYDLSGQSQPTDVFYFRGGTLVNDGAPLGTALRAIDAIEGSSTIGGQSDWGLAGASFARVRTGASLTKSGPNRVTWSDPDVVVDGELSISEGVLRVEAGAYSGAGSTRVAEVATLDLDGGRGTNYFAVSGHYLRVEGTVAGDLGMLSGGLLDVLSSNALFLDDVTLAGSTLRVGGAGFTEGGSTTDPVTTSLQLNYDAAADTPGDAIWQNTLGGDDFTFAGPASPVPVSSPELPALTAAYSIPATGGASGLGQSPGYFEAGGPRSVLDATFEVVFRVDENSTASDQVLFEAGGVGKGIALVLNGTSLTFNVDGDDGDHDLIQPLTPGWRQAIGVIDMDGAGDTIRLYIDGQPVGELTGLEINDWSGGNVSGLGAGQNSVTGVSSGVGAPFGAEIAIARYYANYAFNDADAAQNYGALTPDSISTVMRVRGKLIVSSGSVVELDIAAGGMADKIDTAGSLTLNGGSLVVTQFGDGSILPGEVFDLFDFASASGAFTELRLPRLDLGVMWNTDRLMTTGELVATIAGDFNGDGVVDAADYTLWRDSLGDVVTELTGADADGDGVVGIGDYELWRTNFGQQVTLPLATAPAPEPAGLALIAWGVCVTALSRSRRPPAVVR